MMDIIILFNHIQLCEDRNRSMTEEQIEHIKTLLAHVDNSVVQEGLTLLENEITSAETLCAFFGTEASDGFN